MARNLYPGYCYCCGQYIETGYGHFERIRGAKPWENKWRIKCVKCASGRDLSEKDPGVQWARREQKRRKENK